MTNLTSEFGEVCALPTNVPPDSAVDAAAEQLALLLLECEELKTYTQLLYAVRIDPRVSELSALLYDAQMDFYASPGAYDAARAALDALPLMVEFQRAEAALRELFAAVDAVIGQSAGVDFAANARSACG